MTNVLEMVGIEKQFGPVKALDNVNFAVKKGEVHALLGINGAGKSTLIKILSGIYVADSGEINVDNSKRSIRSPSDAITNGIASVQQHPELVDDFTGYENIFLGQESKSRGWFKLIDQSQMAEKERSLLARLPVEIDLHVPVNELSGVEREIIAILHTLKQDNVKILILDEPTSTLTQVEAEQLFKMMRTLKDTGVSIIYITHRLEEVFEVADRFTVFRGGKNIASMTCDEALEDNVSIPNLMLQSELGDLFPSKIGATPQNDPVLSASSISGAGFNDVSFNSHRGEIIGFFGLVGSGIDELAKALFGIGQLTAGELFLNGELTTLKDPADALNRGIFLLPGDRRTEGLVMTDNVIFNTTLANLKRAARLGGLLRFRKNARDAAELVDKVDLSPPTLRRPASSFSGGNQQKIVVAKGLYSEAEVYVFVEPTVGVDIGARSKIYGLMRELSKNAAVIVMSSDSDEVCGVADSVGALYRGQMVLTPDRNNTPDMVLTAGIMGNKND